MSVYPLANITTSVLIPTANAIIQRKESLDVLEKSIHHAEACFPDKVESQQGRRVQWYRAQNYSDASLAIAVEGDIPTGLNYSNRTVQANLANYTDWVAVSTFLQDTSPTPDLTDAAARLGYRGALRVDNLTRAVFDGEAINMNQNPLGTYFVVKDLRNARTQLKMNNVTGQTNNNARYRVLCAPVSTFDLINDPTVGGYLDIVKFNQNVNNTPLINYGMGDELADVAGCSITETTNVKTITGSPTKYRIYVHGQGGFGNVTLNTKIPVMKQTGLKARFNIYTGKGGVGPWDPTGELGGFASYNIYYTAACVAGNTFIGDVPRSRTIDVASSVA